MTDKLFIQDLISGYIRETPGIASRTAVGGVRGVLFHDENEFIPWSDLGFNSTYGFYRLSSFPDVGNEAEYATWSINPVIDSDRDGDMMYALLDADGYGFLLGEHWQVAELLPVLAAFLNDGAHNEPVDDEAVGAKYFTIAEMCEEANRYDPAEYPHNTPEDQDRLRRRLQRNIQRGNLWGVKQDPQGRYKVRASAFRGWLVKKAIK